MRRAYNYITTSISIVKGYVLGNHACMAVALPSTFTQSKLSYTHLKLACNARQPVRFCYTFHSYIQCNSYGGGCKKLIQLYIWYMIMTSLSL